MEQKRLHELERQCIQNQPAACTSACPVHVDVKALTAAARNRDLAEARQVFVKSVPFPNVIARCCDAPCQDACVRSKAGGSIRVRDLEKAAMALAEGATEATASSSSRAGKPGRVAVIGGGLSGLTAAYEVARKGWSVVLFEASDALGGRARDVAPNVLPQSLLDADLSAVAAAGFEVALGAEIHLERTEGISLLEAIAPGFDAAYLGVGAQGSNIAAALGLDADENGVVCSDPVTFETSAPGVFAGGSLLRSEASWSPITSISDGRRATLSITRLLQRASLSASRADQGSFETSLYTSLEGVDSVPPVEPVDPAAGYTVEEAASEGERCLQCECLECVKACAYLETYGAYPGEYARRIYNNLSIVVEGQSRSTNTFIDSCSMCRLCYEVCPTDFDMGELNLEARKEMVRRGTMPASAFGFALRDMSLARSEQFSLTRHAPGMDSSEAVFFPGCQLAASDPSQVERAYRLLLERYSPRTGISLYCCGAPAQWAGQEELFDETVADGEALLQGLGSPLVILACPTCQTVFDARHPDLKTVSLWEVLAEIGLPPDHPSGQGRTLAVHDPCTARHQSSVQSSVREIVSACGYEVSELPLSRERTECCGFGGLMVYANRPLADRVVEHRIAASDADYVAYCSMCRDQFAAKGKRAVHVLDLIFEDSYDARAERRGPGLSQRSDQRAELKRRLLSELWGEAAPTAKWREAAVLAPSAEDAMERGFIRPEEVFESIEKAEATGARFVDVSTGHLLAGQQVGSITCWVEYSKEGDRFVVHNVYGHRMAIGPSGARADADEAEWEREWRCARDDQELEPRTVDVSYLGVSFPVPLPSCPTCGIVLIPEDLAAGRMADVERMMEDK